MNANSHIPAELELEELSTHFSNNPLFSEDPKDAMIKACGVLSLLRDYISHGEVPGIAEQHCYGAELILRCVTSALIAQCEYSDLKAKFEGAAA